VHSQGSHEADVTEGSGGIWERLRVLAFVLGTVGKGILVKEFAKTVKAIEGRSYAKVGSNTPTTVTKS
jgi:hypothetical protein